MYNFRRTECSARKPVGGVVAIGLLFCLSIAAFGAEIAPRRIPLHLQPGDVLPTGNEWIALPDIRASDGALTTFNVISMRDRGLLQVNGQSGSAVLTPYFMADGRPIDFHAPSWELIEYWIPTAHLLVNGLEMRLTYCAPIGSRAAFLRMSVTNRRTSAASVTLGLRASWGRLDRVTYVPVELRGERTVGAAPWVDAGETFSYITTDTRFAWTLLHPGSQANITAPPITGAPASDASRTVTLNPEATAESVFILSVGIEEFSSSHHARALREALDRYGADAVIARTAAWCHARTRTTGQARLDELMNRNFLFTEFYAWGKTLDTEQLVGITSRSSRYYVSAAYWDRDAMLWSFPGLLDIDPEMAAQALDYALTKQLRNTGIHSRFIDGVVLEDGLQLDELVAPVIALAEYIDQTHDLHFLESHRQALVELKNRIQEQADPATGLYISMQDAQDEFQVLPFITYDNVLTWKALKDLGMLFALLGASQDAQTATVHADKLHSAILARCISSSAEGATGPMFASATDGKQFVFTAIPPSSLMKLPALGFLMESDPIFARTYAWLHSRNYKYSYADAPYGLPGSYRLPFTTSWSIADHLQLMAGRDKAIKILLASGWDGGIITEGVDPVSGRMDQAGRAFATAAGYVAHAICQAYCEDNKGTQSGSPRP